MGGMSPLFRRGDRRTDKQAAQEAQKPQESRKPQDHLVTLIRKPGCHLCDDAHVVIEKVCGELGVPWEQIPVVLVDGKQHTFWRVNEQRLRKALTSGLTE